MLFIFCLSMVIDLWAYDQVPSASISLFGQSVVSEVSTDVRLEVLAALQQQEMLHRQAQLSSQGAALSEDLVYRSCYQMSQRSFNNLMDSKVQDFLNTVLDERACYRDEVLVALAGEYIKHRKRFKSQVLDAIEHELARRQKIVALRQQEIEEHEEVVYRQARLVSQQEKFAQKMQQFGFGPDQTVYLPQDFDLLQEEYQFCKNLYQDGPRAQAAQKSLDQKLAQSVQTISMPIKTQAFLKHKGLHPELYESCYGTALQHQLHKEVCDTFEMIAASYTKPLYSSSYYLDAALECCDVAFMANEYEVLPIACYAQDVAWACDKIASWVMHKVGDYAFAIIQGAEQSGKEFTHMIVHPVETIQNMGRAVLFILETIALADPNFYYCTDTRACFDDYLKPFQEVRAAQIGQLASAGRESLKNCSDVDLVRGISRFGTDCILQHKLIQTMGSFAGIVRTQSKAMRCFEYAAEVIGQEPEFAGTAQKLLEFQAEIEQEVGKKIAEAVGINPAATAAEMMRVRPLTEIQKDIAKYGGKIPLSDIALCEEVKKCIQTILDEVNCKIDRVFKQKYSRKVTQVNNKSFDHNLMLEHVINPEIKFIRNKATNLFEIDISGGHLAGTTETLEAKGLIKILDKKKLSSGCYEYSFEDVFYKNKFTKTEFPSSWNYEKTVKSIWEVYENPKSTISFGKDGKLLKSLEVEGYNIQIVIKELKECANVITAHPII